MYNVSATCGKLKYKFYAGVDSNEKIFLSVLLKIGKLLKKFKRKQRQHSDLISLLLSLNEQMQVPT
jgi:hypothetical protein